MNLGNDQKSDGADATSSRQIALDLNAEGARVTSLFLDGTKLFISIEAELSDSHIRPKNQEDQASLDVAPGARPDVADADESDINLEVEPLPAPKPKPEPKPEAKPLPSAPSSATGIPAPGLDFSLAEDDDEEVVDALQAPGGSEALPPPAKLPRTSDRFTREAPAKTISLGSLDDDGDANDPDSTQPSFAPVPETISLDSEPLPLRPSQRVATEPKTISLGDDLLTPLQTSLPEPTPPAPEIPGPSISLGDPDEISLNALLPDTESTTPALEPVDAINDEALQLDLGIDFSQKPEDAPKLAEAGQPALSVPDLSLGIDDGQQEASPPQPPAKPRSVPETAKEISLGEDSSEFALDLDKPLQPSLATETPMPIMETWDPSTISLDTPMPSALGAMTEESSAIGGDRHGEPLPAISFGIGDAEPPPAVPQPMAAPSMAPVPGLSLAPEPEAPVSADTPPAPAPAVPGISLTPEPAPLSLDLAPPPAPAPAPISLEPQAPSPLSPAPAPLSLEPQAAPAPISLSPEPQAPVPPAPAPLSLEPMAPPPSPTPAPLSLEPQIPAAPSLDLAPPAPKAPEPAPADKGSGIGLAPPLAPSALKANLVDAIPSQAAPAPEPPQPAPAQTNSGLGLDSPAAPQSPVPPPPAPAPAPSAPPAEEKKPEAGGTTVLIRYTCPKCKTQGMQAVDKVGTVVNCSNCGKAMRLVMKK